MLTFDNDTKRRNRAPMEREKPNTPQTRANRRDRVNAATSPITLNGQPAVIGGYAKPFAVVTQLSTGLSCEFAWETVFRVLSHGKFKS